MIPIYYKSSEGEIINLIQTPYRMLTDTDLLNGEWEPVTTGENFPRTSALKKKMVSPKFKIRVTGATKSEFMDNLEHIEGVFDRDCFLFESTEQMGRLYIGNFYRDCIITSIEHGKVFEKTHTVVEFQATSNDSYWRDNKDVEYRGVSAYVGEMSQSAFITSKYDSQNIVYEPNEDGTSHLEYGGRYIAIPDYNYLQFDLGDVIQVGSFSGLYLVGSSSGGTPVGADVQISDGSTTDDARTQSVVVQSDSNRIYANDFTEITIDDFGESGWTAVLFVTGYVDYKVVEETKVEVGDTIDVSDYDYFTFRIQYFNPGTTTSVDYTVNLQDWTTLEHIGVPSGGEEEVVVQDETFRYIRLKGNFFGAIDSDVSIISDEPAPNRNLLDMGWELTNIQSFTKSQPLQQGTIWTATLSNPREDGYITFDNLNLYLKRIYSLAVRTGTITIQGYANDEWVDVVTLDDEPYEETFDDAYDMMRIKIHKIPSSVVAYDIIFQDLAIDVQTNPVLFNGSYAPSEAIIEITGVISNPSVMIGDNEYGANIELTEGHTLEINTKDKTVMVYNDSGNGDNVFDKRLPDTFNRVESGEQPITWVGSADIKITLEGARSIPKWN